MRVAPPPSHHSRVNIALDKCIFLAFRWRKFFLKTFTKFCITRKRKLNPKTSRKFLLFQADISASFSTTWYLSSAVRPTLPSKANPGLPPDTNPTYYTSPPHSANHKHVYNKHSLDINKFIPPFIDNHQICTTIKFCHLARNILTTIFAKQLDYVILRNDWQKKANKTNSQNFIYILSERYFHMKWLIPDYFY